MLAAGPEERQAYDERTFTAVPAPQRTLVATPYVPSTPMMGLLASLGDTMSFREHAQLLELRRKHPDRFKRQMDYLAQEGTPAQKRLASQIYAML